MTMSLNDVLSVLRTKTDPYVVGISLTIHSQAEPPFLPAFYLHMRYVGYGALRYFPDLPNARRPDLIRGFSSEYLSTPELNSTNLGNSAVKVLHNGVYSGDRGSWGEYQSFLAKGAAAELWGIRIDPPTLSLSPQGSQPSQSPARITITLPGRPNRTPWSVDLTDDNAFVRGIGPDPFFTNEKALYCVAFGALGPYAEIN